VKPCPHCYQWLPLEDFARSANRYLGRDSWCRACHVKETREWRKRNPGYIAAYNERRRLEYAEQQREARERTCSECGAAFTGRPDRQTCSPECRKRRKARMDTRWPKAA